MGGIAPPEMFLHAFRMPTDPVTSDLQCPPGRAGHAVGRSRAGHPCGFRSGCARSCHAPATRLGVELRLERPRPRGGRRPCRPSRHWRTGPRPWAPAPGHSAAICWPEGGRGPAGAQQIGPPARRGPAGRRVAGAVRACRAGPLPLPEFGRHPAAGHHCSWTPSCSPAPTLLTRLAVGRALRPVRHHDRPGHPVECRRLRGTLRHRGRPGRTRPSGRLVGRAAGPHPRRAAPRAAADRRAVARAAHPAQPDHRRTRLVAGPSPLGRRDPCHPRGDRRCRPVHANHLRHPPRRRPRERPTPRPLPGTAESFRPAPPRRNASAHRPT